jgi:hypothetical protein
MMGPTSVINPGGEPGVPVPSPLELLREGVESFAGQLQPDGTLHDPVFATPTQYGTAYYAWCCAVLAGQLDGLRRSASASSLPDAGSYRERAGRAMSAALAHTADPALPPHASSFRRQTLSVRGRLNHRDFTWPPILKTYLALADGGPVSQDAQKLIASVDIEAAFRSRPPSNWAAVWMVGEWLRMRAGLSTTSAEEFDCWIEVFFDSSGGVGLHQETGMYLERGLPNAYDLFTRAHLTDLLLQGYAGRNRDRLRSFLATGLRRSLLMQLSDGSVASGFRSAGQTWVLGAQIALFTGSRLLGIGTEADRTEAARAAWRAYASLVTWRRPGGPFSPVQNVLDPELRVGYEDYTADGHYSSLALAFLASAIENGFGTDDSPPSRVALDGRAPVAHAEGEPTYRGIIHVGRISAAVQTQADGQYDGTGLVDLTFGTGRLLQFVSSARHLAGGGWVNPGLALRSAPGADEVLAVASCTHELVTALHRVGDQSLAYETRLRPGEQQLSEDLVDGQPYRCTVLGTGDGVEVTESTPGWSGHRTLLVPYPCDIGLGDKTAVTFIADGVRFARDGEEVEFHVEGDICSRAHLPYGYENRRGLCGLVRLDLREPAETLRWWVTSSTDRRGVSAPTVSPAG